MTYTLITGGSQGIGYAVADEFARRGSDVILVARGKERLRDAKETLEDKHGVTAHTLSQDLSEPRSAKDLIRYCDRKDWAIETLVNNAGFAKHGGFLDHPVSDHQSMLILNCFTPITLAYEYVQRGCDVINVASTAAYQPLPGFASYAASKWYVYAWSVALNREVDETVLTVCPGPTDTDGFVERAGIEGGFAVTDSAERVARETLDAFESGDAVHIVGWMNKVLAGVSRLVPPSWVARLIG